MNRNFNEKHLFKIEIFCNVINAFTLNQLNALNKVNHFYF